MKPFDEDSGPWVHLFDAHSSREAVTDAVDRWATYALDAYAAELAADPSLTVHQRATLVERAAPRVRAETARTFLEVWSRLRAEALRDADGTVH